MLNVEGGQNIGRLKRVADQAIGRLAGRGESPPRTKRNLRRFVGAGIAISPLAMRRGCCKPPPNLIWNQHFDPSDGRNWLLRRKIDKRICSDPSPVLFS